MIKYLTKPALVVALSLSATSLHAGDYSTTYGNWTAFFIGNNSAGLPMCGIKSTLINGGSFMLKSQGDGGMFIHIFKPSWDLPLDAKVPVSLGFDKAYKFYSDAVITVNGESRGLSFNVGAEHLT